eukprot:CAMPEP_0171961460 /NCGR_PEP_ID=MMETSP0993-20121228/162582_1 /TAXON_ID=483369 /ORGANISM="non described non described, Strain CCMP2098" /LENGTH=48 /DNA_ID= /DNA_START= /DNA_END= /DNA_ORIENTATION=
MYKEGQGVKQDFKGTVNWFGHAANQEDADAQSDLGFMYEKGGEVAQDF